MRIDWQMYEDGLLSQQDLQAAEEALRSDPRARMELEGLRAFRRAVRDAALHVSVPQKRLERRLGDVVGRVAIPSVRIRLAIAAAAVCAVAVALVV